MAKPLDDGDQLTYSLSQEIPGGATTWVKCEASTTKRKGETAKAAQKRLTTLVEDWIDEKVQELQL